MPLRHTLIAVACIWLVCGVRRIRHVLARDDDPSSFDTAEDVRDEVVSSPGFGAVYNGLWWSLEWSSRVFAVSLSCL